jgi:hypothetical protein
MVNSRHLYLETKGTTVLFCTATDLFISFRFQSYHHRIKHIILSFFSCLILETFKTKFASLYHVIPLPGWIRVTFKKSKHRKNYAKNTSKCLSNQSEDTHFRYKPN